MAAGIKNGNQPDKRMKNMDGSPPSPRAKGFTLLELMVVMLLIGIVMAVAIPRFGAGAFQDPNKKLARWMTAKTRLLRAKAIQKQVAQALVIDLNNQRMWSVSEGMSEEEQGAVSEKAFKIDESIKIVNIQMPNQEPVSTGTAQIRFHPAGYSDKALILMETNDAERFSYLLEPLLPKMKIFDQWIDS